jgi:hypothetical protein
LPRAYRQARWKVKIRDKEAREPPHVTIIRATDAWRINLRTGEFMDAAPNPDDLPVELVKFILKRETWKKLCDHWDQMYPANQVTGVNEE